MHVQPGRGNNIIGLLSSQLAQLSTEVENLFLIYLWNLTTSFPTFLNIVEKMVVEASQVLTGS